MKAASFLPVGILLIFIRLSTVISISSNGILVKKETIDRNPGICVAPKLFINEICGSKAKFISCSHCAGKSNCCSAQNSDRYGRCQENSNLNCPDGSSEICVGKSCPVDLSCKYINCEGSSEFCWGFTVCNSIHGSPCEPFSDLFCRSEGDSSSSFKVCCSKFSESTVLSDISPKSNVFIAEDMPVLYSQALIHNSDTSRLLSSSKFIYMLSFFVFLCIVV